MSVLSKQSIRRLCEPPTLVIAEADKYPDNWKPLIYPFNPDKMRFYGVSSGSGPASYDATIAHDLVLGRHPGFVIREWVMDLRFTQKPRWWELPKLVYNMFGALWDLQRRLSDEPPHYALAHTVEDFYLPANVKGDVCDKSTFARCFVSAYNTLFDPGFHGNATLELVNDSKYRVEYKAGMGVCQFVFTWLDEPTEEPYSGKYQGQTKAAHGARFEADDVPPGKHADAFNMPSHWTVKYWPWKGGYEYELMRKDFYKAGAWVKKFEDIAPDAAKMAARIDDRQPMTEK